MMSFIVLLLLATACAAQPRTSAQIAPDSDRGLVFQGIGGLSAGASSRLLFDYPQQQRDEILDVLWKPKYGANLQICKIEIGGDTQSTDGTEPSHMHTRDDLNCTRGYELWLLSEARKRNPNIIAYGLAWGVPGWLNNQTGYYGPDTIQYHVKWLQCARQYYQQEINRLGIWNERPFGGVDYIKQLRAALDAANFPNTELILIDGHLPDPSNVFWQGLSNDPVFNKSVAAIGVHYPCSASNQAVSPETIRNVYGKPLWASEDWWSPAEFPGAACWAKLFNQNFLRMQITSTIAWSTVWSVYPQVDIYEGNGSPISGDGFWGPGLVYAWQSWSGHYVVPPTVWASAHTTQFVEPNWRILPSASGNLTAGGSFVSYVSPNGTLFATVIETAVAGCDHCNFGPDTAAYALQFLNISFADPLVGVQAGARLHVFATNATLNFEPQPDVTVQVGQWVLLAIQPGTIYTVTNTEGQSNAAVRLQPPASGVFPAAYNDSFENTALEKPGRYFADQCGSFGVTLAPGSSQNHVLKQWAPEPPGVNQWMNNLPNPVTVIGDIYWTDINVTVAVALNTTTLQHGQAQSVGNGGSLALLSSPEPTARERLLDKPSSSPAAAAPWVYTAGRINGGSYDQSGTGYNLSTAEAFCEKTAECRGFTFASDLVEPKPTDTVWFTSRTIVDEGPGWQSYTMGQPAPPAPPPLPLLGAWIGVCGRISSTKANHVIVGVCLQVNGSHAQVVEVTDDTSSSSTAPVGLPTVEEGDDEPSAGPWRVLRLQIQRSVAQGFVDGSLVGTLNVQGVAGLAALETGWNVGLFDNFQVSGVHVSPSSK